MTVAELIAILEELPADSVVYYTSEAGQVFEPVKTAVADTYCLNDIVTLAGDS